MYTDALRTKKPLNRVLRAIKAGLAPKDQEEFLAFKAIFDQDASRTYTVTNHPERKPSLSFREGSSEVKGGATGVETEMSVEAPLEDT
jgi:hypothetical protein